jgi:hypothetical protein
LTALYVPKNRVGNEAKRTSVKLRSLEGTVPFCFPGAVA